MLEKTDNQVTYFLATTALEEFWDISKPLLFLGEWCRRYSRKSFWGPLGGEVLVNPWQDNERFYRANRYVSELYERILPALGQTLNEVHGVKHSMRYWRIIIGPWLQLYIPIVFDRYMCLQMILDKYTNITSIVLSDDAWITPCDTLEFVQLVKEDAYNLQMYSRILKLLGTNFPQKKIHVSATPFIPVGKQMPRVARSLINIALRSAMETISLFKGSPPIILNNSLLSRDIQLQLIVKTSGMVWPIYNESAIMLQHEINRNVRSKLGNLLPSQNDFELLIQKLLPMDVPQCLVEGFETINHVSRRDYPKQAKAILSSVAWYCDEAFKQWAAASSERGTLLLGAQHGGYYGSLQFFPNEDHELAITDRYYSWGWEQPSHPQKVFPSSATKLSGRKSLDADNRKQGILYVATSWTRYLMQLPCPPVQFEDYLSWQSRFVRNIATEILSKMRARFHREDFGWDIDKRWMDFSLNVTIEQWDVPFLQSLDNCRLCIIDHQGTTFLEALSANKPTVLFWNRAITEPRAEAQPYYDRLRAAGLLYDTPEAAANIVNTVYDDVETWWNDPARQEARLVFCNRFARTSLNAVSEWTETFIRISKEGVKTH